MGRRLFAVVLPKGTMGVGQGILLGPIAHALGFKGRSGCCSPAIAVSQKNGCCLQLLLGLRQKSIVDLSKQLTFSNHFLGSKNSTAVYSQQEAYILNKPHRFDRFLL